MFLAVLTAFIGLTFLVNITTYTYLFFQKPNYTNYTLSNGESIKVHNVNLLVSNAYLVQSNTGSLLIDAGMPFTGSIINSYINRHKVSDVKLLVVSHSHLDHYGGALRVKEYTNVPVAAHLLDSGSVEKGNTKLGTIKNWLIISKWVLPYLEPLINVQGVSVDVTLTGGEELSDYGFDYISILHTPGHTPGSISVIVDNKIAFVGDLVSARGEGAIQKTYANSWEDLYKSLDTLNSMSLDFYFTGHGSKPLSKSEFALLINDQP